MDSKEYTTTGIEEVVLQNDNGSELRFQGKVFSESTYFDEENGALTRMRLYTAAGGMLVYSIVSTGAEKSRRYYSVNAHGTSCTMSDGVHTMVVPMDMLFASVFGLCGIDPERAEELRPLIEETLKAANAE